MTHGATEWDGDYLFIGNSMTFYENTPEMMRQLVYAGTGKRVSTTLIAYGGRTLEEHAKAIQAVIRTQGKEKKLTDKEKELFCTKKKNVYSSTIYKNYVSAIWDKSRQSVKKYKYIVFQMYYRNGTGDNNAEKLTNSLSDLIHVFNSKDSTFVLNATWPKFISWKYGVKAQDTIDQIAETAYKNVKKQETGLYKKILLAKTGRALMNYVFQYGGDYALSEEPEMIPVYSRYGTKKGLMNDVMYGDRLHANQLGAFLAACTVYQTIYRNLDQTKSYTGGVKKAAKSVYGSKGNCFGRYYRNGKGIKSAAIRKSVRKIAKKTCSGLVLKKYVTTE